MSSFSVTHAGRATGFGPTATPGGRCEPAAVNDEWAAFSAALDEAKECDEKTSLAYPASAALLKAFFKDGFECDAPASAEETKPLNENMIVPGVVVLSNEGIEEEKKVNNDVYVLRRMKIPRDPIARPVDKPSDEPIWKPLPKKPRDLNQYDSNKTYEEDEEVKED
jgi:hypothetical protein